MCHRSLWVGAGLLLGCLWPYAPASAEPCAPVSLPLAPLSADAAVGYALPCSDAVAAADAALMEARAQLAQRRWALYNPVLDASADLGGGYAAAQLQQPLSLTRAGPHARILAEARAEAAQLHRRRAALETAAAVRIAYVAVSVSTTTRILAEEASALTSRLSAAVALQAQAGEASSLDLHLARLAEAEVAAWVLEALDAEADALRTLSGWLGTPISPDNIEGDPLLAAPPPSLKAPPIQRLDVRARDVELRAARAEAGLARALALPAVSVGIFWESEEATTLLGPSLSVELPLFDRNQASRAAAEGEISRSQAAARTTAALASAEVEALRVRLEKAELAFSHVQGSLLEDARAALSRITLGFERGEFDLPTTLSLQRQVLVAESAAIRARGLIASARLEYALATEDPSLLGGGAP